MDIGKVLMRGRRIENKRHLRPVPDGAAAELTVPVAFNCSRELDIIAKGVDD